MAVSNRAHGAFSSRHQLAPFTAGAAATQVLAPGPVFTRMAPRRTPHTHRCSIRTSAACTALQVN